MQNQVISLSNPSPSQQQHNAYTVIAIDFNDTLLPTIKLSKFSARPNEKNLPSQAQWDIGYKVTTQDML